MNLTCGKCNTELPTKLTYDLHTHLCNQKKNSAKEITMFQCILALTNKCESLERKLAKIHSCTTRIRKKNIEEYLQIIDPLKFDLVKSYYMLRLLKSRSIKAKLLHTLNYFRAV